MARTLVAGIGNVFRSDDGFGVEVARRFAATDTDDQVAVVDFGIRGLHLACEIAGGQYDTVVLVDTASRGEPPGTLYAIEPDASIDAAAGGGAAGGTTLDAHDMAPASVLGWIRHIGGSRSRILVIGCEPACLDEGMGLSAPVEAAIEPAIAMLREVIRRYRVCV